MEATSVPSLQFSSKMPLTTNFFILSSIVERKCQNLPIICGWKYAYLLLSDIAHEYFCHLAFFLQHRDKMRGALIYLPQNMSLHYFLILSLELLTKV